MLKFWKRYSSDRNGTDNKSSSANTRRVVFQEEVTIVQPPEEIQTFKQPLTASKKFKLFSMIKWGGGRKRKRKGKKSNSARKKSFKVKSKPKGRKINVLSNKLIAASTLRQQQKMLL